MRPTHPGCPPYSLAVSSGATEEEEAEEERSEELSEELSEEGEELPEGEDKEEEEGQERGEDEPDVIPSDQSSLTVTVFFVSFVDILLEERATYSPEGSDRPSPPRETEKGAAQVLLLTVSIWPHFFKKRKKKLHSSG